MHQDQNAAYYAAGRHQVGNEEPKPGAAENSFVKGIIMIVQFFPGSTAARGSASWSKVGAEHVPTST